tara:strand:- start:585 stop:818 length:234 start_codon:yes stop_codon:yes gene_type:complete
MKVNRTFSIDLELVHELKKKTNQSKFVSEAIWRRLDPQGNNSIEEASTRRLMAALHNRKDCDQFVKGVLLQALTRES